MRKITVALAGLGSRGKDTYAKIAKLFPEKIRPYVVLFGDLCVLAFAVYIVITGWELTVFQAQLGKTSPALGLPLQFVNAAPVAGFFLAAIRQIQTIFYRVGQLGKDGE